MEYYVVIDPKNPYDEIGNVIDKNRSLGVYTLSGGFINAMPKVISPSDAIAGRMFAENGTYIIFDGKAWRKLKQVYITPDCWKWFETGQGKCDQFTPLPDKTKTGTGHGGKENKKDVGSSSGTGPGGKGAGGGLFVPGYGEGLLDILKKLFPWLLLGLLLLNDEKKDKK